MVPGHITNGSHGVILSLAQLLQQKQLTSTVYSPASPESMVPVQLTHLTGITNSMGNETAHTSLRAQVQPFQPYTPQQIQEQLQHLHIQQHKEPESVAQSAPRVAALLQQPLLGSQVSQQKTDSVPPSDLYTMIGNIASHPNTELPSFPVNIQTREGSPTKGLGRRSPIHDHQMASIAEDTREEVTGCSTHAILPNSSTCRELTTYNWTTNI